MPLQVLRHVKNRASHMAYGSALYNWSLRGEVPDRIAVRPVDPWPGSMERGRAFCENGVFMLGGAQVPVRADVWNMAECEPVWRAHLHGFSWLRDLRALSGERGMGAVARTHAKMMVQSWAAQHMKWQAESWRPDVTGERLAMWLSTYEFFSAVEFFEAGAEELFEDVFFESVMRQARHLSHCLNGDVRGSVGVGALGGCAGAGRFMAAKGLLYAGVAFEGYESWIEQALSVMKAALETQVAGDGAHCSRSPVQMLKILQILLDVRMTLRAADRPLPESIQHAIDRMGQALQFFRMNDKHLALFHSAQEGDAEHIDSVLRQAGVRGKTLSALPSIGFERMTLGRTHIVMDCGASPARPFDTHAHAAPLAFEMSYGRERFFVNCGSHPLDPAWQDALRATAAHTALSLDQRNACEICEDGHFARRAQHIDTHREDLKNAALLEASHDGYVSLNGFTHKRRIYLSDKGHDVRGEDVLTHVSVPSKPVDAAVRFHLHPKVMVSLIRDGQDALLRLPGGVGWRFSHGGCAGSMGGVVLALEDSVYLGQGGVPRKTKQLVIYARVDGPEAQIKWALKREG